ncbi:hypothetical protein [Niabella ginsengisoli]|uniref:Uncharacterized protein n=1 Tax=Niabella ginsengisoli TaxID=522298 RepID=A0ABS9SDY2_9BACT|nr:hypothetical protein [Niabella ginsengisoli]MCH5596574.1 hypothetical protein [Niabella ginsengisoli]
MTNLNFELPDSDKDKKELRPDEGTLDLPDVNDIPGQENVKPPELNQDENLTAASDDEEGVGILDDEVDDDLNDATNVSKQEKDLLKQAETVGTDDDDDLKNAQLDDVDFEGEKLNEKTTLDGKDLDVPGQEEDDENEDIGEEDEENNEYSLGDTK